MRSRMNFPFVCLAALFIAISGCINPIEDSNESMSGTHEAPEHGEAASPSAAAHGALQTTLPDPLDGRVLLENCTGIRSTHAWAPGQNPGTTYAEWAPQGPDTGSTSLILTVDCHRMAADTIERPVQIVLEGHNHATLPEACRAALRGFAPYIVEHAWTSDQDASEYLANWTGLQFKPDQVRIDEGSGVAPAFEIVVELEGVRSTWNVLDDETRDFPNRVDEAWLWTHHNGSFVSITTSYSGPMPDTTQRQTIAEAHDPLLLGSATRPTVSNTDPLRNSHIELRREFHETMDCE